MTRVVVQTNADTTQNQSFPFISPVLLVEDYF